MSLIVCRTENWPISTIGIDFIGRDFGVTVTSQIRYGPLRNWTSLRGSKISRGSRGRTFRRNFPAGPGRRLNITCCVSGPEMRPGKLRQGSLPSVRMIRNQAPRMVVFRHPTGTRTTPPNLSSQRTSWQRTRTMSTRNQAFHQYRSKKNRVEALLDLAGGRRPRAQCLPLRNIPPKDSDGANAIDPRFCQNREIHSPPGFCPRFHSWCLSWPEISLLYPVIVSYLFSVQNILQLGVHRAAHVSRLGPEFGQMPRS